MPRKGQLHVLIKIPEQKQFRVRANVVYSNNNEQNSYFNPVFAWALNELSNKQTKQKSICRATNQMPPYINRVVASICTTMPRVYLSSFPLSIQQLSTDKIM